MSAQNPKRCQASPSEVSAAGGGRCSWLGLEGLFVFARRERALLFPAMSMVLLFWIGACTTVPTIVAVPLLVVFGMTLLNGVLRRLRFDLGLQLIVMAGACLYLGYLTYTDATERNCDAPEQFHYILHVLKNGRPPPESACTNCYHPPLYYGLAALAWRLMAPARFLSLSQALQGLSLSLFLAFLIWSILLIREFAESRFVTHLATALVVFWPSSVLNSVRVHNDVLVATLSAATLYFTVRWRALDRNRELYLAAASCGLAILTKSSGYVLALVITILMVFPLREACSMRTLRRNLAVLGMLTASFGLTRLARIGTTVTGPCEAMLGRLCNPKQVTLLSSRPLDYLPLLHVSSFWRHPFLIVQFEETGSRNFWICLLKSSLLGVHHLGPDPELSDWPYADGARLLNALLLGLIAVAVVGVATSTRTELRRRHVLLLAGGLFVVALGAFHVFHATPYHGDFRHIFVLLVPLGLICAETIGRQRFRSPVLFTAGGILAGTFIALSIAFFLPLRGAVAAIPKRRIEVPWAAHQQVRDSGTAIDTSRDIEFNGHAELVFAAPPHTTAASLDVSLGSHGWYQIDVVGRDGMWRTGFVPGDEGPGLIRYQSAIDPPVREVQEVVIRAVRGDGAFAMGHMLVGRLDEPSL